MATTKSLFTMVALSTLLVVLVGVTNASDYCQVAGSHCLSFDGDDYVSLGNGPSLQLHTNITVSAWFKMDSGNSGRHLAIAGKLTAATSRGFGIGRFSNNGVIFWTGNGSWIDGVYSNPVTDTEWHHLAGVRDGALMDLFLDGDSVFFNPYSKNAFLDSGNSAFIGRMYSDQHQGYPEEYFDGLIDDVRIYNRGMSEAEVAIMMKTLPGSDPSLVGYWNLNEGTGSVALDSSGNNNHGQLQGAAWASTSPYCGGPPTQVIISGYVRDLTSGQGIPGVTMTINVNEGSDTTGANGFYSLTVPYGWSGSVTPSKAGLTFTPPVRTYTNLSADALNNDYTALPAISTYYVSVTGNDSNSGASPVLAFLTIQRGLTVASSGDTVIVLDGTYTGFGNRDLDFGGKNIILKSENGPQTTVIDCQNSSRAFYVRQGETQDARIEGFTITRGNAYQGGAIYCQNSSPTITNCHILSNSSNQGGAGVFLYNSDALLSHCVLAKNVSSAGAGGAIRCDNGFKQPVISQCTVADNTSGNAGGGLWCRTTNATVENSIFWGNQAAAGGHQISLVSASLNIAYCDVEGGQFQVQNSGSSLQWGAGNVDVDPLFGDPSNNDYYLRSERGRYYPDLDVFILDSATSPVIDAGDPLEPIGDERKPNGDRINMGAFGGTVLASLTHVPCDLVKDENNDGIIDYTDLFELADRWLTEWSLLGAP